MSGLSQLMNGADCGPSNPLQGLTKTFDRDRSLAQDASTSRAGPSRGAFRTVVQNRQADEQAAAFFAAAQHAPLPMSPPPLLQQQQQKGPWNMESLRGTLPQPQAQGWAQDFMRASPAPQRSGVHTPVLSPPPPVIQQQQAFSPLALGKQKESIAWAQDFGLAFAAAEQAAPAPALPMPMMQQQQQQQQMGMSMGMGQRPMGGRMVDGQFGAWFVPELNETQVYPPMEQQLRSPLAPPPLPTEHQLRSPFAPPPPSAESQIAAAPPQAQTEQPRNTVLEVDDLAATASLLLESVKTETNPKFKNSQFMSLMHQFRDRTATVEGNEIVAVSSDGVGGAEGQLGTEGLQSARSSTSTSASLSSAWARGEDVRGQEQSVAGSAPAGGSTSAPITNVGATARAYTQPNVTAALSGIDPTWAQWADLMPQPTAQDARAAQMYPEILQTNAEDWHEYQAQLGADTGVGVGTKRRSVRFGPESTFRAQEREWDALQDQWDEFETAEPGVRHTVAYRFQENNPYAIGRGYTTRHHALHTSSDWAQLAAETVLEKEAAVQRDPSNASAWYELGVRQQENEREQKAIQALRRAVELDPEYIDAWLALAVSLVNESDRRAAYDAIESWIERNKRYAGTQKPTSSIASNTQTMPQRQELLMQQLIAMARDIPAGEIDADVQVALGVLFNINEDYEKAIDCFHAALEVRREDWQLYNRIGASYANSGNPEKALEYYRHALQLNPGYIRARYNLGIAEINLKHYTEAAQHILDALVLQESEANSNANAAEAGAAGSKGVTSSALWFGLRNASAKMRRPDLVTLCDQQDLEAYRVFFAPLPRQQPQAAT
ncbi:TPR-like protein [Calocera cornea HHB12733]|uniref:TPR-like protein n=1 Tax=Calocera cornea HHB12733 TaxID=1353952 RepID=A0A165H5H8_9BASI|nr:TPR-like protein [Calocera cornea HHB12733]